MNNCVFVSISSQFSQKLTYLLTGLKLFGLTLWLYPTVTNLFTDLTKYPINVRPNSTNSQVLFKHIPYKLT